MWRVLSFIGLSILFVTQGIFAQKKGTDIQLQNKNFKRLIDKSIDFSIPLISVNELHENLDDFIILDAREKEEFEVSHLPGAIYVGYDQPELKVIENLPRDKKLLFYCSIGYRSEKIGEKAKEMGFDKVYNLYGSIFEWVNEGYELETTNEMPTQKVHGYNWIWGRWIQNKDYEKVFN